MGVPIKLSGRLEVDGTSKTSFTNYRVEVAYLRRAAPSPDELTAGDDLGRALRPADEIEPDEFLEDVRRPRAAAAELEPVTALTEAVCDPSGEFVISLPPIEEIVSDQLIVRVRGPSGGDVALSGVRKLSTAALPQILTIKVTPPPQIEVDASPAPSPSSRRILGRLFARTGARLASGVRVVLSGRKFDADPDSALEPIVAAEADPSGYFYAEVPTARFQEVLATVPGAAKPAHVRLVEDRIPPRVPIVVDFSAPQDLKSSDCSCGPPTTPRRPSQELIAESPELFSADLGTSGCIRFNVPNRAVEEFNFYSVVRTSEPAIFARTVGPPGDTNVSVPPQPPVAGGGVLPPPPPLGDGLRSRIEVAIRAGLAPLEEWRQNPALALLQPITWNLVETTIRNAVLSAGGDALSPGFFAQFNGWGQGVPWGFELGTVRVSLAQLEVVVMQAAIAGAGTTPRPPPGVAVPALPPRGVAAGGKLEVMKERAARFDDLYSLRGLQRPSGRVPLDARAPVDWDSTPTFYEAATIAHGHLLHFKQVWYADGYSLGDLLKSIPLGPGQKKLISVIDWERREQLSREERTTLNEGVGATFTRDRDLNEVVSGTLSEMSRGGSQNTTAGVGVGTGAAGNGSYQGMNFGALIGVSGGVGDSVSSAYQDSAKSLTSSSLQTLRDRTLQSASAVRDLRSTVVQSVRQGETVRASSEVIANHNHCHALTIQYFEVLRHFAVTHELADVQECLFVPFPMSEFNRPKVLRWRQPLSTYLQRPELATAFAAARRVETQWNEDWSPSARYADELVSAVFGELTLTIIIPLPSLPEKPKKSLEELGPDAAERITKSLAPTEGAMGIILGIATLGASAIVGAVTSAATDAAKAAAQGAKAFTESLLETPTAEERYARFQQEVMPAVAAGFVDRLELYALAGNNETRLTGADFTLVSEYRPGTPLLVSVRGRIRNPISRADITALVVKSSTPLPPGCRAIVNSAQLRYQTQHFRHDLLSDDRVNDDIDLPTVAYTGTVSLPPPPGGGTTPLGGLPIPLPPGFPSDWIPIPGMTPISGGTGATLYTPIDEWEQRYPRLEDMRLAKELIEHLNANLEFYHHAIWWTMDPNRRFMLLDGYEAPNAMGKSVASVVENSLLGIVGNSLILPVARGQHLDPQFKYEKNSTLLKHYAPQSPVPPSRVSLPTRGVFAEAVMGDCNACEEIDDTRFWRWEESPTDEPPSIDTGALASRRSEPTSLTPTAFPAPIVAFQNVPQAPEPTGLSAALGVLGKESPFKDITGLAGTQANAAAAYAKAVDTALQFGKEASELAKQASMTKNIGQTMRAIDKAETESKIDKEKAKQLRTDALRQMTGGDGKASIEEVKQAVKTIDELKIGGSIASDDAQALNRKALESLVERGGRDDQAAGSNLLAQIPPSKVKRLSVGGDGATQVETEQDAQGDAAELKAEDYKALPVVWPFRDLVNFAPPIALIMAVAPRGFSLQKIDDGWGDVNLDQYLVKITTLPKDPQTDAPYGDTAFFESIRRRFPTILPAFPTTGLAESLAPFATIDGTTWNSDSPLGTVMQFTIAIPLSPGFVDPLFSERALVLCTEYISVAGHDHHWNFSTMGGPNPAGYHPVSGTRQFGLRRSDDGWIFYIRAADRMGWLPEWALSGTVYEGQDQYWKDLQTNLAKVVVDGGGAAEVVEPSFAERFPWDQVKRIVRRSS